MSKNKFEKIMEKNLSIVFDTYILDEDEDEKKVNVFELKREYSKIDDKMKSILDKVIESPKEHISNGYIINEKRKGDSLLLDRKIQEYKGNFCFDLNILSNGNKIGRISLTRILVNDKSTVLGFIDYESPQSMDIANYILDKDFDKVYDTYVAIYDCFMLDEEYKGIGIEEEVISMLDSFLIDEEFEVSKIYMKAISISKKDFAKDIKSEKMLEILNDCKYELVDSNKYILCNDLWGIDE